MPDYLTTIFPAKCPDCGRKASVTVFNGKNARVGTYCMKDGARKVAELNKEP